MNNYIRTGYRKTWICFDLDNGHSYGKNNAGKGYVWIFSTRKEARGHCKKQRKMKFAAKLSQPIKIEYQKYYE